MFFQKILDESKRKPNKIWVDKGSEFYCGSINEILAKIMIMKCIQHKTKNKLLF